MVFKNKVDSSALQRSVHTCSLHLSIQIRLVYKDPDEFVRQTLSLIRSHLKNEKCLGERFKDPSNEFTRSL